MLQCDGAFINKVQVETDVNKRLKKRGEITE